MCKAIIAGSRDFEDFEYVEKSLQKFDFISEVVCGKARGADTLGEKWANINNIPVKTFPADWDKLGKSAGYIRNEEMAIYGDMLIAFWDGKSPGTKHMIKLASKYKLEVVVFKTNNVNNDW